MKTWISFCLVTIVAVAAVTVRAQSDLPDTAAANQTVDLHTHPFIKYGLGIIFKGHFNGPLKAKDWTARLSTQINPETMDASGAGVVVASLYAHPIFAANQRQAIREQILEAREFVASHPNWIIATSAEQGRQAFAQGKRVLVLSLEGAAGILENEQDLKEFIDDGGIRIVTPLHLKDDHLGGAALLGGYRGWLSPVAWLRSVAKSDYHEGAIINPLGLSDDGRTLARELIKRGVWIDLSHASDESQNELIPMMHMSGQPLLYTHTVLRRYHPVERALSEVQLGEVLNSGGIIGLEPIDEMLKGTLSPDTCRGGMQSLAQQYTEFAQVLGADAVMIGTDFNGGIGHISAKCPVAGADFGSRGFWNLGQLPLMWKGLANLGAPLPPRLSSMVDRFFSTWAKVKPFPAN